MKIRHFFLDARAQLRKLSPQAVHEILAGRLCAQAIDTELTREIAIASAVCDDNLIPDRVYLLRVPLSEGQFTAADQLVLKAFARPDCVTPGEATEHHRTNWPADLTRQLAVALDVPVSGLDTTLDTGGPVLVAAVTGVSVARAARELDRT